jgi:hypothetical protein
MRTTFRFALTVLLAILCAGLALAQSGSGAAPAPQLRSLGGIDYVNGGAGTEARDAITAMQGGFGLKLVFSDASGEYLVADHLAVKGHGGEVFDLDRAGPWLLVKLPPGRYTVTATYEGKSSQQVVDVGAATRTLNWRLPGG